MSCQYENCKQTGDERWAPLPGWAGFYEVSDRGRVRSLDRVIETAQGPRRLRGQTRKLVVDRDGYRLVNLSQSGEAIMYRVHRLVLETFVGPCPPDMEALHADDEAGHGCLANLSWGYHVDNMSGMVARGRHVNAKKECCKRGHLLVGANLYGNPEDKPQRRACRACGLAHSYFSRARIAGRAVELSFQQVADQYFAEIVTESVKTYAAARVILARFLPAALDSEGAAA